ncbi:metal dependent phosphohydrolase [Cladophialophora carrionii]|uniref:Metal dependent phosphohydrolase n=1 Tax=Cladophialophora carrionii TaxID=86049 RepID=A0A1C1CVG9_9EURO|nr:metal dependent phosphohydrolase [Cladophialophora carrionii]
MASTSLPTKVLAGVTVPDTPLISKALDYTRQYSTPDTYNHIVRSFLLGFIIADKVLPDRDREAHALAAIMHDLGFPLGHPPNSDIITTDKRFEVDGANAARRFLQREAPAEEWDKHRLQLVWDSIALHTIGSIVFEKEAEVQACSYGIWADFQGPDRVPGGLLTWDEYNAVVKEYPRLDLMKGLKANMCHLCELKPQTTYDNTVGEWGDRYVEGYSRKGKLTQDLLETCNLDEL